MEIAQEIQTQVGQKAFLFYKMYGGWSGNCAGKCKHQLDKELTPTLKHEIEKSTLDSMSGGSTQHYGKPILTQVSLKAGNTKTLTQ